MSSVQTSITKPYIKRALGRWIMAKGGFISARIESQMIRVYVLPPARDKDTGDGLKAKASIELRLMLKRFINGQVVREITEPIKFRTDNPEDLDDLIDQLTKARSYLKGNET